MVSRGSLRRNLARGLRRRNGRWRRLGRGWRVLRRRGGLTARRQSGRRANHTEHEDYGQSHTRSQMKSQGLFILRLWSAGQPSIHKPLSKEDTGFHGGNLLRSTCPPVTQLGYESGKRFRFRRWIQSRLSRSATAEPGRFGPGRYRCRLFW